MTCTIISTGEELLVENKNEHEAPYPMIKAKLIWGLYCQGYDTFCVNCEYGIPLWAAEFICSLKGLNHIILNIMVPYEEQSVNWSEEQRNRYISIHEASDQVVLVNTQYHSKCYQEADERVVDESNLLVICGNADLKCEIIKYAEKQNVQMFYYPALLK